METEPLTRHGNPYQFGTLDKWKAHVAMLNSVEILTRWHRWLMKEADGSYRLHCFDGADLDKARFALYDRARDIGAKWQSSRGGSPGFFYDVKEREAALAQVARKHQRL